MAATAAGITLAATAAGDLRTTRDAVAQQRAPESAQAKRQKSAALAAAKSVTADGRSMTAEEARAAAAELGKDIPLPEGGNFNGIRWEELEGAITSRMISTMLQYNAACQWWRADVDGGDGDVAQDIVGDIPGWNALRETEAADLAAKVRSDRAAGGGPAATAVVQDCAASQQREAEYAAARGFTPTK